MWSATLDRSGVLQAYSVISYNHFTDKKPTSLNIRTYVVVFQWACTLLAMLYSRQTARSTVNGRLCRLMIESLKRFYSDAGICEYGLKTLAFISFVSTVTEREAAVVKKKSNENENENENNNNNKNQNQNQNNISINVNNLPSVQVPVPPAGTGAGGGGGGFQAKTTKEYFDSVGALPLAVDTLLEHMPLVQHRLNAVCRYVPFPLYT